MFVIARKDGVECELFHDLTRLIALYERGGDFRRWRLTDRIVPDRCVRNQSLNRKRSVPSRIWGMFTCVCVTFTVMCA